MRKIVILAILIAVIIIAAFTGGFFSNRDIRTLSVTGSTTVLPIVQIAADEYMDMYSDVNIVISGGGSSVGVKSAGEKTADIGMSSRDVKDSEKANYPALNSIVIAKDGIALIVHPSNSVNSLAVEEIKAIYKGKYTNWSELGGEDMEIVVIGRDSASGTREFFFEHVMNREDFVTTMLEKNSNGAIKQTISQTPGAIGYVGLGYLDETVKVLPIKKGTTAVEPTIANIQNGSYPIARSLYLLVNGEPEGLMKDFIEFILSPEGQAIVKEEGFVPV